MLRVHFLNVGHGDCTIIKHHSGRLTMIDINNSQDYDDDSFKDYKNFLAEQTRNENRLLSLNSLASIGAIGLPTRNTLANLGAIGLPPQNAPSTGLLSLFAMDFETKQKAKSELTDPIKFLQENYPGQRVWRFVLTHPDLDHMRGIKALYDKIGIDCFWDTKNTKTIRDFRSDDDKLDWEFYQQLRTASFTRNYTRGDSVFAFGKDENGNLGGDNIEILSPTTDLVRECNIASESLWALLLGFCHLVKSPR